MQYVFPKRGYAFRLGKNVSLEDRLSLDVKHSRQMVGPTNRMPVGLHLGLLGSWSWSSSICSALWNAVPFEVTAGVRYTPNSSLFSFPVFLYS